jgi:[ribosomal protein S5]-alanine N-acetyltransferase
VHDIPELVTPRLRLRGFEPRDFDAYATMMAEPEVTRHRGDGKPLTRVDAWRQLAMFLGHWSVRGFGIWAVELRATGELAGRIGLHEPGRLARIRGRVYAGTTILGKRLRA